MVYNGNNDQKGCEYMKFFIEKSISDAKQHFPDIIREASAGYEVITCNFKSNKSGKVSIISTELFEEILDTGYKFYPVVEKDLDGKGYTIALDDLLTHGEGHDLFSALEDLSENIYDYAQDYLSRMDFFRQIENRKDHYPYLRRIIRCQDIYEVMEVISECHIDLQQEISKRSQKDWGSSR
jgi:hypothetical protein